MSNFKTSNLIPFTAPLKPGQRLLKLSDGTFLPIGIQGPIISGAISTSDATAQAYDIL